MFVLYKYGNLVIEMTNEGDVSVITVCNYNIVFVIIEVVLLNIFTVLNFIDNNLIGFHTTRCFRDCICDTEEI